MIELAFVLLAGSAHAQEGYGVPDTQGHPNYEERSLHLWVNAARVDPQYWADQGMLEAAGCSIDDFAAGEADPKPPIYYDADLGQVARFHADDMHSHEYVGSDSSDGTKMEARVGLVYPDTIVGETNASGHILDYGFVLKGWLCDPDARSVLLSSDATELGTGLSGFYGTVDVGGGTVDTKSPVTLGTHYWPGGLEEWDDVTYVFADWTNKVSPYKFQVISAGFATDLDLYWGDDHDGVWGAVLDIPESQSNSCHQYFFYWELTDGTYGTYPEEGSLTFGTCNTQRGWLTEQVGLNPPADDEGGCATTRSAGSLKALAILAGLFALRRRR
jgi:hypothetical protein